MNIAIVHTPIGFLQFEEEENAITKVFYIGTKGDEIPANTPLLKKAIKEFEDYFNGSIKKFTFKMNPEGTEFQKNVWNNLLNIEYGKTISYKELAILSNSPNAARAVGSAMRKNPIVIAVPCHRVVPSSGKLGNYSAGGPFNKDWLLTFENQNL